MMLGRVGRGGIYQLHCRLLSFLYCGAVLLTVDADANGFALHHRGAGAAP